MGKMCPNILTFSHELRFISTNIEVNLRFSS